VQGLLVLVLGSHLMLIPELFARDASPGDGEIIVLALPPHFDSACGT
jgi:hypothetical protein